MNLSNEDLHVKKETQWCNIAIVKSPVQDDSDYVKDNFSEELQCIYHTVKQLADFSAKLDVMIFSNRL
jgi:hypothetical protein